jgi:hypothetical protein
MTVIDSVEAKEVTAVPSGDQTPRRVRTDEHIAAAVEAAYILEAVRK